MPHQCTACGRTFPDGSKEMLSGCPDCGGNKFQFQPKHAVEEDTPDERSAAAESPASGEPTPDDEPTPGSERDSAATDVSDASDASDDPLDREWPDTARPDEPAPEDATTASPPSSEPDEGPTVADIAGRGPDAESPDADDSDIIEADPEPIETGPEDSAQANARTDVVSKDELSHAREGTDAPPGEGGVADDTDENRPDIDELRQELNDQFESIRIVSPGQYELNLMELYDRQEYIISLQEDGRYVIEMPDAWGADDE